ncbi:MAG: hypothetical protein PHY43_00590 [Verrucomicrobiales bacterium]|nr:hypothetical protein [Verrucomicrobiales bacterium]
MNQQTVQGAGRPLGFILFSLLLAMPVIKVGAGTLYWTNSAGGFYSDASNWSPNITPGAPDEVVFTNANAYTFTIDTGATNSTAYFHQGIVTQSITGVWYLTNAWRVGETVGSTSRVTAVSGSLIVTNEAGTGILSIGRIGTGELALRGGSVVADTLLATNGIRSILTFGHGDLTTLQGVTVSNASKVTLGTTASNLFVWNAIGGMNRIITGQFDYGGLTLGANSGGSRARINLSGSNTVLSVPGLDTYGRNEIFISGGAKFQTYSVQLGLQSGGVSNVVVISDPGSSWINDYLMYFGMHSGAQTMIITNGGYFRTGGTTYSDQHFTSFDNPSSKIIITGSNSWFHSDGVADFGISWSSPVSPLNNLLLVTNGGRFWARQLTYGSTNINLGSVSRPGNLINVADGSLWIGSLTFAVGTLRIEAGSGTIDQLSMTGGTNAVIQTLGNLYVGHHGNLGAGELRVGGASMTIASLNGQLEVGGWQMGAFSGDSGNVTMTGGRAYVTNASQTGSLVVGGVGGGMLRVNSGLVQADLANVSALAGSSGLLILNGPGSSLLTPNLVVGTGGIVVVSNAATLQISNCTAPVSTISVKGATLEFISGTPIIPSNAIAITNATISFRNATAAELDLSNPTYLGRIQRSGSTILQLIQATNASVASLIFRGNDASTWSGLILNGGTSAIEAGGILIETNSALAATNSVATIAGTFTNRGQIILNNSTLRFVSPVTLSETSSFQGSQGFLLFVGGLHLPATDIVVPAGIAVQASSITSDGGKLVINGGGIIPNDDGTVPSGMILFQNGWVTYLDTPTASVTPPVGLSGALGLELIRSTNAPVISQTFATGAGGYERLRMGSGSGWRSQQLVVGQGGGMFIADPSASVALTSGVFRVEQGGLFQDDTGGTSHVGFSSTSSNASATFSGNGSTWLTPNAISVGAGGSQNQLLVEFGGKLLASSTAIGSSSGNSNRLTLNGAGASCFATNGLTVAGSQNQFLIQTGGAFSGSQIMASGSSALVSLAGTGAVANCSTQIVLSGSQSRLQVAGGANLFTSNGVLNAVFGSTADVSGEGSFWKLSGGLTISAPLFSFRTNFVTVINKGSVIGSSLSLNSSSSSRVAALSIQSGQLFVTNVTGTANMTVNGPLNLDRGLLHADKLTASSASFSVINIRAGKAEWAACDLSAGIPLRIGDGTNLATLNLLGSTNICRSGLEVRRYSRLTGSGAIIGAVTNRGALWPSVITIQSNLVMDSTSELAFSIAGAPGFPQNSSLVVTGSVSLAGSLEISINPGVTLSNSQSFVLIQYGSIASAFSNIVFGQRLLTSDGLASFRIDDTGAAIIATAFQSEDLDGDGIQDAWAMQHFGISPLLPGTGTNDLDGDWDGDGLNNHNEFLLGTDPNDPASGLFVQLEMTGQSGVNVHFPYLPNRSYHMRTSDDLLNWTDTLIEDFRFDSIGLAVWSDTSTTTMGKQFYQLLVQ